MNRPTLFWVIAAWLCLMASAAQASPPSGFVLETADHAETYAFRRVSGADDFFRFELRAGDCAKQFDCTTHRERAEIKEAWRPPLSTTVWYRFRLMLPVSYPEMSPKQILGQWHDGTRPALSNRYENGSFWLDLMSGDNRTTHRFEVADFGKGQWNEMVYAIRWSAAEDGRLQAWHNGRLVADYSGPTLSSDWTDAPRFKIGIYRSHLDRLTSPAPTQVAFAGDYSRVVERRRRVAISRRPLPR